MSDASFHLSQKATIQAHIEIAKRAIASSENDLRRAAEHLTKANLEGASQREIAARVGRSVSWVNDLIQWCKSGFKDETPHGPGSKARRERARVRSNERTKKANRPGRAERDKLDVARARAQTAKAEAAKAKADAAKATAEARRATADAAKAQAEAAKVEAEARTARARANNPSRQEIHSGARELLVKFLGMLGSELAGERDTAARFAERERKKLGMTWDELIIPATDADARRRDGAADFHTAN